MRIIPYLVIHPNSANVTYHRLTGTDREWVLHQCKQVIELAPHIPRFNIKHNKYLKQSTGTTNTAESLCSGIISNFKSGQYDLSEKQCGALVEVFSIGEEEIEGFNAVVFEQVDVLPKLVSQMPVIETYDGYDIDMITVVYKKK